MSTDALENGEKQTNDEALTSHNINMLLNLISKNDQSNEDASEFPQEYDWSQPAKSWWRYFKKQTEQNTALCYTCGSVFNRGPKQSTTSLSHHLKMYHREQFILIQQAKDEDLRHNNNNGRSRSSSKRVHNSEESASCQEDYVNRKKSAFNLALIEAVRKKPELYDCRQRQSDENQCLAWEKVSSEIGVTTQIAKKCWLSLSQRYKKEMKIALRDEFLYKPKWPYFWDLNFLDEHLKNSNDTRKRSSSSANSSEYNVQNLSYLNSDNASTLLNNIFKCAKSPLDEEENGSTDSAFASTSEHSNDQDSEQNDVQKQDSNFLTIQQLFSAPTNDDQLDESQNDQDKSVDLPQRNRSRKAPPARLQKPTMATANESSFDWLQDEDELFGKIIALRLRNLGVEKKRQMKIQIEQLFERGE